MGCGVNGSDDKCLGCCGGSKEGSSSTNQPIPIKRRNNENGDGKDSTSNGRKDTIVDGISLREANIGHYFAETELYGCGVSRSAMRQLEYRHDKWKIMCTYRAPKSHSCILLF
jgi:hypothetical protein